MKLPHRHRRLPLAAACAVLASAPLGAATDDALRPIAFQNGVNQQSLSTETAELARAIDELIDELQRNGFPLQSLAGLSELAAQLNALGGTEMSAIATRLRRLGENAQADPRATAAEAYLAQQAIENRLKSLARQISIQQLREEAARRLEALIAREVAIQRETRAIAAVPPDAERQRLLESDQEGVGEDLTSFFQTGENLLTRLREKNAPAATPTAPAPASSTTFSDRINGAYLNTLSTEALEHLKAKRYPDAYAREGALIVELRKILQGILSSLPKEQRLANALQEVSALRQQEEAREKTETSTEESKQEAADKAESLADQVATISPEAAAALKEAAKEIKEAPTSSETPPSSSQASTPPEKSGEEKSKEEEKTGTEPETGKKSEEIAGKEQGKEPGKEQGKDSGTEPSKEKGSEEVAGTESSKEKGSEEVADTGKPEEKSEGKSGEESSKPGSETKSPTSEALAKAEAALQKALAEAQALASGAKPSTPGQEQSGKGEQQQPGQNQPQTAQQGQQPKGEQQGEQQGKEQGKNGPQQASNEQQSGQLQDSQMPSDSSLSESRGGNQVGGHGPTSGGGPAQVVGALRSEEREAFNALQNERYPAEYSAWVQQYWRNLAQER